METKSNDQAQNKGFTVYVGDTYVGFLTINERNVPAKTVAALQKPENMKAVLANDGIELRPYGSTQDVSAIDNILADVG